ncbi:MAG: hypothetical protein R3323_03910 [Wenzhouxiangellaceae bacterium]|nr:hypothetical protein [Wenzhouxiangellaceae bacterium]
MVSRLADLQNIENSTIPSIIETAGVDWVLELAPIESPSPASAVPRYRALADGSDWTWPFRAPLDSLPFADESLPAILVRHLFDGNRGRAVLDESLRCLAPGGALISVSANPWHRRTWKAMGRAAWRLPSWPAFLIEHARRDLRLDVPARQQWSGWLPGVSPLLVLFARKPPRGSRIERIDFGRQRVPVRPMAASNCRAA